MQKINFFHTLLLFFLFPNFAFCLELISNKQMYQASEKAVLLVKATDSLSNSEEEFVIHQTLNNHPIRAHKLSEVIFASVESSLLDGDNIWEVSLYKRNKESSRVLEVDILKLQREKKKLQKMLSIEKDSVKIPLLVNAITNCENLINSKNSLLLSGRTLISSVSKVLRMNLSVVKKQDPLEVQLSIYPSENVPWGTYAAISAYILSEEENIGRVEAKLNNVNVEMNKDYYTNEYFYDFMAQYSNRGSNHFEFLVFELDSERFETFNVAAQSGVYKRFELLVARDSAVYPELKEYYEAEVEDLNLIIDEIFKVIKNSEIVIASESLNFSIVTPLELVSISPRTLILMESGTGSYTFKLRRPPVGNAQVTIESNDQNLKFFVGTGAPTSSLVLHFDEDNWQTSVPISMTIPNNGIIDGDRLITVSHSIVGGGFAPESLPNVELTVKDFKNDLICNPSSIYLGPYDYGYIMVSLPSPPVSEVTVSFIDTSNSLSMDDFLYFDESNWNIPQMFSMSSYDWEFGNFELIGSVENNSSFGSCRVDLQLGGW